MPISMEYGFPVPDIPRCANNLQGVCPRSQTFVEAERHNCFVIKCKTCGGINIFPREEEENRGRYDAFLRRQAARTAQEKYESSRPDFSFPTRRP
jgi:hypothetical protein